MKICRILLLAVLILSLQHGCGGQRPSVTGSELFAPLAFAARVINLPTDQPNMGKIVFLAEVQYADLQFIRSEGRFRGEVEFTFALSNPENSREVRLFDHRRTIFVDSFEATIDRNNVVRLTESVVIPTGTYDARITVADASARSRGSVSNPVVVRDFLSSFVLSEPLLASDSMHTFQIDKVLPLQKKDFRSDFYAFAVIGGVNFDEPVRLTYQLQDTRNNVLYERSASVNPGQPVLMFSLPVPVEKLSLGTTLLRVLAEQGNNRAANTMRINATFGSTRSPSISSFRALVGPMRYVMPRREYDEFVNAPPDSQQVIFKEFWQKRDPTPADDNNPLLEEFTRRVEFVDKQYAWTNRAGFQTDRGRIYIIYGPPDEIKTSNQVGANANYEVWTYVELGRQFVFIDRHNDGNFELLTATGV